MATAVGKDIGLWKLGLQPAGKKIDGQGEPVHLDKESNDESGKSTQRAPVDLGFRLYEAKGK
jgi:hypothetical protein